MSWFAAWVIIGTVGAWAFASAGPCYFNTFIGPDANYAELQRRLAVIAGIASAQGHPIVSIDAQAVLLKIYASGQLEPAAGISAMPSMHSRLQRKSHSRDSPERGSGARYSQSTPC